MNNKDLTKFQAGVVAVFATSQESWLTGSEVRHRLEGDPSISTVKRGLTRLVGFGVLKVNKGNGARGGGYANRYGLVQDSPSTEREPENPGDHPKEESGQTHRPNSDAGLQDGVVKEKVVRDFTECPLYHAPVKLEGEGVEEDEDLPLFLQDSEAGREEFNRLRMATIVECPNCHVLVSRDGLTNHLALCEGHIYNADTGRYEELSEVEKQEQPSQSEVDKKIIAALRAKGKGSVSGNPDGDDEDDDNNEENPREDEDDEEGLLMPWMEDKKPRAKEEVKAGMFGLFGGYSGDEDAKPKDEGGGSFFGLVGAGLLVASLIAGVKSLLK